MVPGQGEGVRRFEEKRLKNQSLHATLVLQKKNQKLNKWPRLEKISK